MRDVIAVQLGKRSRVQIERFPRIASDCLLRVQIIAAPRDEWFPKNGARLEPRKLS